MHLETFVIAHDHRFSYVWDDLGKLFAQLVRQQGQGLLTSADVHLISRHAADQWDRERVKEMERCSGR